MKVVIIIPCFNEGNRLDANKFIDYLSKNTHLHFIFVDDGSTDNTSLIINRIISKFCSQVSLLKNETNKGKAESVRSGVIESFSMKPDFIGYLDADLAAPIEEIDHLLISFNQSESINLIDEKDFYVGEISFISSNANIVLKGGNNTGKLSRIRLEEKSILPKLNNLIINIPPELSVVWSEEQVFTTDTFEGTSETIINKLDMDNIIIDPESEQKLIIPFIGQNQMEPGDIIYISDLLYNNESDLNTQSRITYLGLEVANGIFLPDSIPTYLASAYFESLSGNNIINRDTLHAFRLNEMTIANDTMLFNLFGVELVEAGDTLLMSVPNEFSILWSDSIENNISITDMYGNDWKDSKISISINDQYDELSLILIEDIGGNTLSINNLQVDIADSTGLGYIKLFNKNTGESLGVDKYPIAIGTPTINFLEDKNIVWLNAVRNKKLPTIKINESIIFCMKYP